MPVKMNLKSLDAEIERAFHATALELGQEFQAELTGENRVFPRTTYRRFGRGVTGRIAESPRDVVDSGKLVNSYRVKVSRIRAEYTWGVPYAILIYTGYAARGINVSPFLWCHRVVMRVDIPALFKENYDG